MSNQIDDWRVETQSRLNENNIYRVLKTKCESDPAGAQVLALIDDAAHYAYQRSKLVLRHMGEFTLHDGDHLFRVLMLMNLLIGTVVVHKLSVPEILLLILSVFFHDIGMAPAEREVRAWLQLWENDEPSEWELQQHQQFERFTRARPRTLEQVEHYRRTDKTPRADLLIRYLVSEYIRETHSERARTIIADEWADKIVYRDTDLSTDLATICFSHEMDTIDLLDLEMSLPCGPDTFVCLPFVGACLRLADILDFDSKRTPRALFAHLGVHHPVSLKEWQKHRAITAWTINSNVILFAAKCNHPAIEYSIHKFIDLIDRELIGCEMVLSRLGDSIRVPFPDCYKLQIPPKVDRSKIGPRLDARGRPIYEYRDCSFTLNQSQIVDLAMGTKMYKNPDVALRELVQNSIDACKVRLAMERVWDVNYEPEICIEFAQLEGLELLRVTDNGIGMDQHVIDRYFCSVGDSYYKSSEFYELQTSMGLNVDLTSRFGIGILSCFMVAHSISVETRRLIGPHDSSRPLRILIEGPESIFWLRKGTRQVPGTTIELWLLEQNPWSELSDRERIEKMKRTVLNPAFPLLVKSGTEQEYLLPRHFLDTERKWYPKYRSGPRITVDLTDPRLGLVGQATVALLEERGKPVAQKIQYSKNIRIEGERRDIRLKTQVHARVNSIRRWSDTLRVMGTGVAKKEYGQWEDLTLSRSHLAVRGIAVPMNLFESPWVAEEKDCVLKFPFAMELVIDITGSRDIDLNSARSRIIFNEKWLDLVETLAYAIGREIKKSVGEDYWKELQSVWKYIDEICKGIKNVHRVDERFFTGIDRVSKEPS